MSECGHVHVCESMEFMSCSTCGLDRWLSWESARHACMNPVLSSVLSAHFKKPILVASISNGGEGRWIPGPLSSQSRWGSEFQGKSEKLCLKKVRYPEEWHLRLTPNPTIVYTLTHTCIHIHITMYTHNTGIVYNI